MTKRSAFCLLPSALCLLLLSCSSAPPTPAPEWNAIPLGITETLCLRLKAEGVAEGVRVVVVRTTQPIASMHQLLVLAGPIPRRRPSGDQAAAALRMSEKSIPLTLGGDHCEWIAVDAADAYRRTDQMIVEMTAPMPNPFERNQAGIFVRVSLAGEHGQWYWISLIPRAGGWTVGFVQALSN